MPIPTLTASETPSNSNIEPNPVTDSSIPTSNASQPATNPALQQKTEAEEAADRLYEERIEEEYAKREGGAWRKWYLVWRVKWVGMDVNMGGVQALE